MRKTISKSTCQWVTFIAEAMLPLWLLAGTAFPAHGAEELQEGRDFVSGKCYAHLTETQLIVGNSHLRRAWRLDHGRLFATSVFDLDRQVEWMSVPSPMASPTPPADVQTNSAVLRGASGVFGPTQAGSLRVELETVGHEATVDYEFQVFPDATGIRIWTVVKGKPANSASTAAASTPDTPPGADVLEHLQIANPHLRLIQVTLRDSSDHHNELVSEDEWLLHPNESLLELQGNIFILEDTLTGDGLVFLKEAPLPEMRPVKNPFDLWFSGSPMTVHKSPATLPMKNDTKPAAFLKLSFYGNGFTESGVGYQSVLLAYHGGRSGRIAVLQQYQRQIRQYVPGRDGLLMSNTWGDRSYESKLNEDFIRKEIDAGKALGVDVVQIDGGWNAGKTRGLSGPGGVWEGYWKTDPHFWETNSARFPNGLSSLAEYAHSRSMQLSLWFAPDSYQDFANWRRDAEQLLKWNRDDGMDGFKLDSVEIRSKQGEQNYFALLDTVLTKSNGKILLDLDVTDETRQGYFGNIAGGPMYIENRYTDLHRYWPHQTLRNFWKLAQYVDPVRLRMEFLNSERNTTLYPDDPLAPVHYQPSCLFATTMFASPLAFFENTGLSKEYVADAAPVIAEWKKEREAIYRGTILPIGEAPDGVTWTGFASVAQERNGGYLLVFRELNQEATWMGPRSLFAKGSYRIRLLGGQGKVTQTADGFRVSIPQTLGFVWVKLESKK